VRLTVKGTEIRPLQDEILLSLLALFSTDQSIIETPFDVGLAAPFIGNEIVFLKPTPELLRSLLQLLDHLQPVPPCGNPVHSILIKEITMKVGPDNLEILLS
jgi:hypothetical protein